MIIPPPVNGEKYRDEEAIKHSVIMDAEMDMYNSSHQDDQGGDDSFRWIGRGGSV